MNNLEKFAAQRLTKNQMNNIKGGAEHIINCVTTNPQGVVVNTFQIKYDDGGKELLQSTVEDLTPIGCMTVCRRA